MSDIKQKVKETREKLKTLKEDLEKKSKELFSESIKELFNIYPDLEIITWTQYTPYFNDGDECVFSANTDYPELVFKDEMSLYEEEGAEEVSSQRYDDKDKLKKAQEIEKQVISVLTSIDDDTYRAMFGNHVEVVVSRKGIEVNEYDHD